MAKRRPYQSALSHVGVFDWRSMDEFHGSLRHSSKPLIDVTPVFPSRAACVSYTKFHSLLSKRKWRIRPRRHHLVTRATFTKRRHFPLPL